MGDGSSIQTTNTSHIMTGLITNKPFWIPEIKSNPWKQMKLIFHVILLDLKVVEML
jgi:hypothetical protein